MKQLNVLLIGDDCTDIYVYGVVNRISPEAPIPVLEYSHTEQKPGMSGNVRLNLENMGCTVTHLKPDIASVKTRYIDLRTQQQLLRLDSDYKSKPLTLSEEIINSKYDFIVISDYDKGAVSNLLIDDVMAIWNCPIFIDTKKTDLNRFDRIYPASKIFIKINEAESKKVTSWHRNLIVTLGKDGARFRGDVYPCPQVSVSDVCGAGDTFLSSLAVYHNKTGDIIEAIKMANIASSITVKHLGVYAPTLEEIENASRG